MSIPESGFPRTAAVSPRVQVVESTGSTNSDVLAAAADDPEGWPHLALLLTTDQRAGRGRLDRTWTAPPGSALAVSVVVRVPRIPPAARGWIPLVAGAAMTRAIEHQLTGTGANPTLKWPNDVLVDGLKICGILAEAVPGQPDAVVVGAGVNTRMSRTDLPVTTAVSFAALGLTADEDRLLADYLTGLDRMLRDLGEADGDADAAGVRGRIRERCATVGSPVTVSRPDGTVLTGVATDIDAHGRLIVEAAGDEVAVAAGDITHLR